MKPTIVRIVVAVAIGLGLVAGVAAWAAGWFNSAGPKVQATLAANTAPADKPEATLDDALALAHRARKQFADVRDYRCLFLRDEFIDGRLRENVIRLKIRHQPFSVYMKWLAPRSKRGREVVYVEGKNDGKMIVKSLLRLRLDPKRSIALKESRHTIKEAGLKFAIEKMCRGWERERPLGRTEVDIHDGELRIQVGKRVIVRPYRCVVTRHDPKDRSLFTFYRARVFFDRETHLPIRLEAYDWPASSTDETGQLLERYTYLDLETNIGLTDEDFEL